MLKNLQKFDVWWKSKLATGFLSYHIYNTIRYIHFNSKKYDITKMSLPKREMFLKKWNDEMIKRKDSLLFLKIDKLYNSDKEKLIRLFTYYYLENKDFYVTDIIEDNFNLYKENESQLRILKDVIEKDFYKIYLLCCKNHISIKQSLFSKKGIPIIFKMYDKKKISIYTLIAFNMTWDIFSKIRMTSLNIVEEEKIKKYSVIFDKYVQIIYKHFEEFDIKEHLKFCYKNLIMDNRRRKK